MSNDRYPWFDADRSYYGVEWDRAWRFGTAAGEIHRKMEWSDVAVTLESMWNHSRRDKSWYEARPAIYAAWRTAKLRHEFARGGAVARPALDLRERPTTRPSLSGMPGLR